MIRLFRIAKPDVDKKGLSTLNAITSIPLIVPIIILLYFIFNDSKWFIATDLYLSRTQINQQY